MEVFNRSSNLPVSCEEAFAWHERPGAFERMQPPWEKLRILERKGTIYDGDSIKLKVKSGCFSFLMYAKHQNYIKNKQFEDILLKSPFRSWKHTHSFENLDINKSKLIDNIKYELPFGFLSPFINRTLIKNKLDNLFAYRHRTLNNDLFLHSKYSKEKLKILVTGASGMVGKDLVPFLTTGGHEVICLSRKAPQNDSSGIVYWNSEKKNFINPQLLENLDAVVHLAGENIAAKKWTVARKLQLTHSRVHFTQDLCKALATLQCLPKVFVSASGIGIFGSRDGSDILTEESSVGDGFLAKLAQDWENASLSLQEAGVRVVNLRFGAIVSSNGGILKKLVTPFKLFVGGPIGSGRQMLPWISMVDVLGLILFSLSNLKVVGPVNAVSPQVVTNAQFSEILAQALDRPNSLRIPELFVELFFGEMGKSVLLSGQNAKPQKILQLGYEFIQPHLHDALSYYLPV